MSWKSFQGLKDGLNKGVGKLSNMTEKFINENLKVDDEEADKFFKELEASVSQKKGPFSFEGNPKVPQKNVKKSEADETPQNPIQSQSPTKLTQSMQLPENKLSNSAELNKNSQSLLANLSGIAEPLDNGPHGLPSKETMDMTKSVEITRTSADMNLYQKSDEIVEENQKKATPNPVKSKEEDGALKNKISQLEEALKKKSDEVHHLQKDQEDSKKTLHARELKIQELEADKKELDANIHALKDQRNTAERNNDILQDEIDILKEKVQNLEKSLHDSNLKYNELQRSHIEIVETSKAETKSFQEKLTKMLADLNTEAESAGLHNEQLTNIFNKVFTGVESSENKSQSNQGPNEESIKLKIENQSLKNTIEELERLRDDLKKQLQIEHEKSQTDKQALLNSKDQVEELTAQLHEAKEVIKTKDNQIKQLEAEGKPDQALMAKIGDLTQSNFQFQEHINLLDEKLRNLTKDSKVIISERDSLKQQLSTLESKKANDELSVSSEIKQIVFSKLQKLTSLQKGLDLEKLGESKLSYLKDNRIALPVFSQALEDTLKIFTEVLTKRMNSEQEEFKNSEKEKSSSLDKALSKAKNEAADLNKKLQDTLSEKIEYKKKSEDFKEKFEDMTNTANQYLAKIKEIQKQLSDTTELKNKLQDDLKEKTKLIEQQKERIRHFEESDSTKDENMSSLQEQLDLIPELQGQIDKKNLELSELKEILEAKISENEALNMSITNIQTVLDENQQIHDNISLQYDGQIKKLRNELEQAHRKNELVEEYKQKCEAMEKDNFNLHNQVKEIHNKLRESDQEKLMIQSETEALVKKMKAQAIYQENLVDKRFVINCLIKYFDMNSTYAVKMGTLDTLSSILTCTEDERAKMGLKYYVPEGRTPKFEKEERTLSQKGSLQNVDDLPSPKKDSGKEKKPSSIENIPNQTPEKVPEKPEEKKPEPEKTTTPAKKDSLSGIFMSFLLDKDDS